MTAPGGSVSMAGRSAIIVPIGLPPELAAIRDAGDRMAPRGVPPHVTVLFPFLHVGALGPDVQAALTSIASHRPRFVARFDSVERLDVMVWLVPRDQEPFLQLTADIAARWPDHPPYEGAHARLIAHLTLVETSDVAILDVAEAAARAEGLIEVPATELRLITEDEAGRWHTRWQAPLRAGTIGP